MTREIHRPMVSSSSRPGLGREKRLVVQNHIVHEQVFNMHNLVAFFNHTVILQGIGVRPYLCTCGKRDNREASGWGKKTEVWNGGRRGEKMKRWVLNGTDGNSE